MPGRSDGTVKIEYPVPRKDVEAAVQKYLRGIRSKIGLRKAILFGSYAKGDYSARSDIDLAIIADNLPADQGERFVELKDTLLGLDLQPFAYTKQEWNMMLKNRPSFTGEILKSGRVMFSRHKHAPRRN